MKVLDLLEEIEEIVDTASGFPLTGKIMVDAQELLEIVREIRLELPDEIQQASGLKTRENGLSRKRRRNMRRLSPMPSGRRKPWWKMTISPLRQS